MVHTMDRRLHHIKLVYCDENPRTIWRKYEKGNNDMRPPRILGKSGKDLDFMNSAMKKYLSTYNLHVIVLDSNIAEKDKRKEDDGIECSTNE